MWVLCKLETLLSMSWIFRRAIWNLRNCFKIRCLRHNIRIWTHIFGWLKVKVRMLVPQSCQLFVTPWTAAHQAPLSMGFSKQEYWSGLPLPSPGDLPNTGIKPGVSGMQADSLPSQPPGKFQGFFLFFIFFPFIFISWRLITLQYCSDFSHTLTWISHGFTYIPHPDPPSHLPLHPIPLGLPSAPALSTCLMHPA